MTPGTSTDESGYLPPNVVPELSGLLPDPVATGPTVFDVAPLDYIAEDRLMTGLAATYLPIHEGDFTVAPAPAWTLPHPMGGEVGGPASGPPPLMPGLPRYRPSDCSRRRVLSAARYTTRLIIYRPRDLSRFSGNVIVETIHPVGGGATPMWAEVNKFLASRGDVFVGVQHPRTFAWLGWRRPGRYDGLYSADFSQVWGMLADAARLFKQASPIGVRARRAYLTGYSFTGLIATSFARQHHDVNRLPDGTPLFDGYPIGTGFGPMPPLDVPVMIAANQYRAYNDTDEEQSSTVPSSATRAARESFDADGPMSRRRRYEVVGFQHAPGSPAEPGAAIPPVRSGTAEEWCAHQRPPGAVANPNVLGRAVYEGMFRNIADWVDHAIVPPRGELIETSDGRPRLDEYGNPRGGVRMPDVTAPVARYETGWDECANTGWMVPFSAERLRQIYGDRADYLRRYSAAADAMVAARFILPERGAQLKQTAARAVPEFGAVRAPAFPAAGTAAYRRR